MMGITSVFLFQFTSIVFLFVVFGNIQEIKGWTFYNVLFIYGVASTGRAIHHIFFDNLWSLGSMYIRPGNFDRILIRPINPLFHLIAEKVQKDGVGQLIMGIIILSTAIPNLSLVFGWLEYTLLIVLILSSGLIFVAINLIFSTLSFWMVDSLPITSAVSNLSEFARYPLDIYHKYLKTALTWIIPYGFTAFYPAAYFVEDSGYHDFALLSPAVAIVFCAIAYWFWNVGLNSFTSTGT
ncbi:ABC-2 family transporter protein [Bacillus sp. A116_S68]|jgi:ABC-2 type transport system permease protein|nr:ABC-2 family transporter protein [Bacillus sp. A116_S68]